MKIPHILIASLLALPCAAFAEEEKSLALEQVPAEVAAAVRAAAGKEPVRINEDKEDGVDAFEASWSVKGLHHEMKVTPQGKVIAQEEQLPLEAAPAPVQTAIKALSSEGTFDKLDKVTEKDVTLYEATFKSPQGELEVKFDATGKETARELEKSDKKDNEGDKDHEDHDED